MKDIPKAKRPENAPVIFIYSVKETLAERSASTCSGRTPPEQPEAELEHMAGIPH
ncbi:hypothetical protein PHLCEN_2v13406 [Hermanssonia centrifuga]|uniref:Uncharacterized protein n=1 Tax=Hermanssonia centrifuga TaxID=98765 RepID=A0A2R6NEB7_9APHY|nr:hypothetical protein PHLCEN_2v13406 [Hermanssonia centrifuga]